MNWITLVIAFILVWWFQDLTADQRFALHNAFKYASDNYNTVSVLEEQDWIVTEHMQ